MPDPSPNSGELTIDASVRGGAVNIAVALRRRIIEGDYVHGERLPSERHLAARIGAARGTVREALRQLEAGGLVARRLGSGTYVTYRSNDDSDDVAAATSPLELIDVRVAVEPQMIRLAVTNASARDLQRLDEALLAVEAALDPGGFSRADEAFHLCLAECTRNPLMIWLYRHLNDVRGHAQWHEMRDAILSPERIGEYNDQHRALVQAIRSRDAEAAIRIVAKHLEKARRDLLGADGR